MNTEIDRYIREAPQNQREIMETIRALMHKALPGLSESFKWSRPVFGLNKDFAYLRASKTHVTLGFYTGENLPDPGNKLEGTGKDMRHIKLKSLQDIDAGELKQWFGILAAR